MLRIDSGVYDNNKYLKLNPKLNPGKSNQVLASQSKISPETETSTLKSINGAQDVIGEIVKGEKSFIDGFNQLFDLIKSKADEKHGSERNKRIDKNNFISACLTEAFSIIKNYENSKLSEDLIKLPNIPKVEKDDPQIAKVLNEIDTKFNRLVGQLNNNQLNNNQLPMGKLTDLISDLERFANLAGVKDKNNFMKEALFRIADKYHNKETISLNQTFEKIITDTTKTYNKGRNEFDFSKIKEKVKDYTGDLHQTFKTNIANFYKGAEGIPFLMDAYKKTNQMFGGQQFGFNPISALKPNDQEIYEKQQQYAQSINIKNEAFRPESNATDLLKIREGIYKSTLDTSSLKHGTPSEYNIGFNLAAGKKSMYLKESVTVANVHQDLVDMIKNKGNISYKDNKLTMSSSFSEKDYQALLKKANEVNDQNFIQSLKELYTKTRSNKTFVGFGAHVSGQHLFSVGALNWMGSVSTDIPLGQNPDISKLTEYDVMLRAGYSLSTRLGLLNLYGQANVQGKQTRTYMVEDKSTTDTKKDDPVVKKGDPVVTKTGDPKVTGSKVTKTTPGAPLPSVEEEGTPVSEPSTITTATKDIKVDVKVNDNYLQPGNSADNIKLTITNLPQGYQFQALIKDKNGTILSTQTVSNNSEIQLAPGMLQKDVTVDVIVIGKTSTRVPGKDNGKYNTVISDDGGENAEQYGGIKGKGKKAADPKEIDTKQGEMIPQGEPEIDPEKLKKGEEKKTVENKTNQEGNVKEEKEIVTTTRTDIQPQTQKYKQTDTVTVSGAEYLRTQVVQKTDTFTTTDYTYTGNVVASYQFTYTQDSDGNESFLYDQGNNFGVNETETKTVETQKTTKTIKTTSFDDTVIKEVEKELDVDSEVATEVTQTDTTTKTTTYRVEEYRNWETTWNLLFGAGYYKNFLFNPSSNVTLSVPVIVNLGLGINGIKITNGSLEGLSDQFMKHKFAWNVDARTGLDAVWENGFFLNLGFASRSSTAAPKPDLTASLGFGYLDPQGFWGIRIAADNRYDFNQWRNHFSLKGEADINPSNFLRFKLFSGVSFNGRNFDRFNLGLQTEINKRYSISLDGFVNNLNSKIRGNQITGGVNLGFNIMLNNFNH